MVRAGTRTLRCACVACQGQTVAWSRRRFGANIVWMLQVGLFSVEQAADALSSFETYHQAAPVGSEPGEPG